MTVETTGVIRQTAVVSGESRPILRALLMIPTLGGGGAERQLVYLAGALPRFGWDVHVAAVEGGERLDALQRTEARFHLVPRARRTDPILPLRVVRLVHELRPDVVLTWLPLMDMLGGAASIALTIPWVRGVRAVPGQGVKRRLSVRRHFRRWLASHTEALISNSQAGADAATAHPRIPRFVIPNGIDFAGIAAAPAHDRASVAPPGTRLVLVAGRFAPEKNHPTLIRAIAQLRPRHDVRVLFCGAGSGGDELRRVAAGEGIADRVVVKGFVDDIWSWMKAADVMLSASEFDGHPNSVLEAAVCGVPLVLSDIAAHREAAGDAGALFVPSRDVSGFATAIAEVFTNSAAAAERAARAAAHVAPLAIDVMASRYDEIFREIAARRPRVRTAAAGTRRLRPE